MGAAESRPPPPSWLVEACATLDPRDVDEVVTLFRRAAKNAEAHGEPGASCPANPKDAAAYVFELERRLGWHEHDASAREASREAFGTPPPLDAVLDRLARSVLAGDATTSGTPGAAPRLSATGDAEKDQPETHKAGALCAALVSRAACRRAASGDRDAVARLGRAVLPKRRNIGTDFQTADFQTALELVRALASVALPPDRTTEDARRRDAFLRRVAATSESITSDDSSEKNERSAFTTLLAQSTYDASMPSRRGRLVPALFDEDGATRLFAESLFDGESSEKHAERDENAARRTHSTPLISPLAAWFLSRSMPATWRTKWRRVFCSKTHGASFAALVARCADEVGPALVAVETTDGFVVGGVVSESPRFASPAFFGDARCFVFSLGPTHKAPSAKAKSCDGGDGEDAHGEGFDFDFDFGVFGHARGANENFCYCAYGFSSDRFPNGLGFGGQVGHHCLFLDAGFETGHWRATAATFGKVRLLAPCVSDSCGDARNSQENVAGTFRVRAVEAWAVDGDFQARLAAKRRAENRRGAGSGARGGVRAAKHDEVRALMETARRDAGPERQER